MLLGCSLFTASAWAQQLQYPWEAVSIAEGQWLLTDLDGSCVWKLGTDGKYAVWVQGSNKLKKPLNRPRAIAVGSDGTVYVGDSATREVYVVAEGAEPSALTGGAIGIPTSIVVMPSGELMVSDLETRTIVSVPAGGGEPKLFAEVSARGLALGADGTLWAIAQEDSQLARIDSEGKVTKLAAGRPFEFANCLTVAEDGVVYVTDNYKHAIWQVASDGTVAPFFEGEPLKNPLGILAKGGTLYVTDSGAKQVFAIDRSSKEIKPLIAN
jgi:sugar lactone lactonase YvrE